MMWLHKFLHPHCPDCKEERLDSLICESCNTLRQENAALRKHNDQLIQALLDVTHPKSEPIVQPQIEIPKPFSNSIPWRQRRHMLETEDKKAAELLRAKQKEMNSVPVTESVEKLEQELGIDDASENSKAV